MGCAASGARAERIVKSARPAEAVRDKPTQVACAGRAARRRCRLELLPEDCLKLVWHLAGPVEVSSLEEAERVVQDVKSAAVRLAFRGDSAELFQLVRKLGAKSTKVQGLSLAQEHIDRIVCRALANALLTNDALQVLVLDRNPLGDLGVEDLVRGLRPDGALRALSLNSCYFGRAGAVALAKALPRSGIQVLSIQQSPAGADAGSHEAGWNPDIGPAGACAIAEAISHGAPLRELALRHATLGLEGLSALSLAGSGSRSLVSLDLASNGICALGAAVLAEGLLRGGAPLERLSLAHNPIGPKGAADIAAAVLDAGRLRELNLRRVGLGPGGAATLAHAQSPLRKLLLSGNWLDEQDARALAGALRGGWRLVVLGLERNQLGDAGGCCLAGAIAAAPCLLRVNLSRNGLGESAWRALWAGLAEGCALRHLVVDGVPGSAGVQALAAALAGAQRTGLHLAALNLSGAQLVAPHEQQGEAGLAAATALGAALAQDSALAELRIRDALGALGAAALLRAMGPSTCCKLAVVDLSLSRFIGSGISGSRKAFATFTEAVVGMACLRQLVLRACNLTLSDMRLFLMELAHADCSSRLEVLDLSCNVSALDDLIGPLCRVATRARTLRTMNLTGSTIMDSTVLAILGALRRRQSARAGSPSYQWQAVCAEDSEGAGALARLYLDARTVSLRVQQAAQEGAGLHCGIPVIRFVK